MASILRTKTKSGQSRLRGVAFGPSWVRYIPTTGGWVLTVPGLEGKEEYEVRISLEDVVRMVGLIPASKWLKVLEADEAGVALNHLTRLLHGRK